MKKTSFIISLVLTIGFVIVLNSQLPLGDSKTPPLGKFLNPFVGFWQNGEAAELQPYTDLKLDKLKNPVQVVYDDKLVPHIFAQDEEDAYYVQGYITAQHRLWQMDFQVRATEGKLSEVLGKRTINYDKQQRRIGLAYAAEKTLERWIQTEEFRYLEAYCNGVNAYINSLSPKDYPIEYKILNYKPEEWTPYKSAVFIKSMANTLARHDQDVEANNMLNMFGREVFDFLYPDDNPKQSPIIPPGTPWDFEPVKVAAPTSPQIDEDEDDKTITFNNPLPKQYEGLGSNNWAVSGKLTSSGNPILCGDPHLRLSLPSIWYEIQISTPESNAYGVSLPGIPFIIIGFNENIAWTQTNVGRDVLDWYKIKWDNAQKSAYQYDGKSKAVTYRIENIKVRGGKTVVDSVRYTHHGPVAYENPEHPKYDLALKWMVHEEPIDNELAVFWKLNKAKNYEEYVDAIMGYECPAQNYAFASKDGDIALWTQGRYPLKYEEQGRFILDGSKSSNDWQGYIPKEHNPHIKNPERGYISSANQHSTDSTYPYYYRGGFSDYRGRILNQKLDQMSDISIEDMMKLQNDKFSLKASESLPVMLANLNTEDLLEEEKEYLNKLKNWNYEFVKDSYAPTVFDVWFDELYVAIWDEIMPMRDSVAILYPETWRTIALINDEPNSDFIDDKSTAETETLADLVTNSFKKAASEISSWEKKNNTEANWRNYKNTKIGHLADIPGMSRTNVDIGGYGNALNAVSHRHGPSWRMIVELGDEIKAYGLYPGGQSGNPGSPFYDNFVDKWAAGEYYEIVFMKNASQTSDRILFEQTFE